jgi:transposase
VAAGLVLPYADTAAMNAHLAEIARTVAPGAHAVLVLDGAGWHGGKGLVVPDTISLLTLPPCAPELNPVENVWQFLRANWLAISVFDGYDAIVAACRMEPLRRRSRRGRFHHLTHVGTGHCIGPLV